MTAAPDGKPDLLAQLAAAYQHRQQLDQQSAEAFREEVEIVAKLRQHTTWQTIADTLGRAKQNVIATYRPHLLETRTVRPRPNPKEKP